LVEVLIKKLEEKDSSENLKISCINILKDILENNEKFIDIFMKSNGLQLTLQIIEDSK
jgi:hypothetical protein